LIALKSLLRIYLGMISMEELKPRPITALKPRPIAARGTVERGGLTESEVWLEVIIRLARREPPDKVALRLAVTNYYQKTLVLDF
jgi:hypothetical protein